ncbi:hypothetical protein EYZ11_000952 [Aspergillus tanneri]|uniref:Glucosamine 6-phosphate N-acetyltransferase n=1 Tax=Aspergillus tanneri TaxID=1220188 RepID=A0A4S3JW07_9EURO|nr:uncharacterized protein ATNIH1004_000251 [Aspergillus tanneri]KAA8651369.1 hypothetical protein ATNIH1004_000251 [Aspergillus tanneri]THC99583.1 hypothetical protein EYZ11_000952 [Aspergillus tanneri]
MPPPKRKPFSTSLQPPPGRNLTLPTPSNPQPDTNPAIFNDAMAVRLPVFVTEQQCSADAEIDSDDAHSWHWVIYHHSEISASTHTTKKPVAVIRLVPPPHAPHEVLMQPERAASLPEFDLEHEPCVKITRVAVLPEYRGYGLGKELVETVLAWTRENASEIDRAYVDRSQGSSRRWKGLVLVHAQVQVEKLYERMGFTRDDLLGRWDEEGIQHVGMWRRVHVKSD